MSKKFSMPVAGLAAAIAALLASACATHPAAGSAAAPAAAITRAKADDPDRVSVTDAQGTVVVQKREFRPGTSSATVERLAREAGCFSDIGAGLVTEPGPVEIYRMQCQDGRIFMARCELRQCKPR